MTMFIQKVPCSADPMGLGAVPVTQHSSVGQLYPEISPRRGRGPEATSGPGGERSSAGSFAARSKDAKGLWDLSSFL